MSYAFPLSISWHCLCGDVPESHVSRASGEECHGHCQSTPLACRGFGYRPIEHTGRTPAIKAIFEAAGSSPNQWPRHYTSDLSVDYKALIAPDAPERFIWILRESGTHLYPLDVPVAIDPAWSRGYVTAALRYHAKNNADALVFHWNGFTLDPVNYDTALVLAALPSRRGEDHGPQDEDGFPVVGVADDGHTYRDWNAR